MSAHPQPRVLVDATAIPEERGGVGRYVDHLTAALDAAGVPLVIVCQQRDVATFERLAPKARIVPVGARVAKRSVRFAWEQAVLPGLAGRLGVDVIHSPHYTMPLRARVPVVVTLHDATFFSDPELHLGVKGRFFRTWTKVSLRRAAACIVPSQATARELAERLDAPRARMTVAYHGVDDEWFHPPSGAEVEAVRRHLGLGGQPWIAFLGTLEPRKNVPALIRAFVKAVAGRDNPPALVLAGAPGWDDQVGAAVAAVPPSLTVLRPGHLPFELLAGFLGGAEVVAYPSLGEGFGLPVLEAMACGAAVLTTERLSLPEVGGDAVAYSDVDAPSIAAALATLLDDPARRAALSAAAVARAATFTWEASAAAHHRAFEAAAASGKR